MGAGGIGQSYGAMSGRDGAFSMGGVPAGVYLLMAERTGFVQMLKEAVRMQTPAITLQAGRPLTDYKVEMSPRAVIAGRVTDEYGDPVPNVRVEASPVKRGGPAAARSMRPLPPPVTDDRGEFRISGGPGTFYVKATPPPARRTMEIRSDGSSDAPFAPTWYPAAASAGAAEPVEARAGEDVRIEIRLNRENVQGLMTIAGTVSGIPERSTAVVMVGTAETPRQTGYPVQGDGAFTIPNLPAVPYRLTAYVYGSTKRMESPTVEVQPDPSGRVEVKLALSAGIDLAGTVEVASAGGSQPAGKRTVTVGGASGTTGGDGTCRIGGIFPGKYAVAVQPLADDEYVKSVDLDGTAAPEGPVDFTRVTPGSSLKIVLGADGGQISGTVVGQDGKPLERIWAMVMLAPVAKPDQPPRSATVAEGGGYTLKNIPPGKYRIAALDVLRSGPLSDEFRKLAARAPDIEVPANGKIARDLKLMTKADEDAAPEK